MQALVNDLQTQNSSLRLQLAGIVEEYLHLEADAAGVQRELQKSKRAALEALRASMEALHALWSLATGTGSVDAASASVDTVLRAWDAACNEQQEQQEAWSSLRAGVADIEPALLPRMAALTHEEIRAARQSANRTAEDLAAARTRILTLENAVTSLGAHPKPSPAASTIGLSAGGNLPPREHGASTLSPNTAFKVYRATSAEYAVGGSAGGSSNTSTSAAPAAVAAAAPTAAGVTATAASTTPSASRSRSSSGSGRATAAVSASVNAVATAPAPASIAASSDGTPTAASASSAHSRRGRSRTRGSSSVTALDVHTLATAIVEESSSYLLRATEAEAKVEQLKQALERAGVQREEEATRLAATIRELESSNTQLAKASLTLRQEVEVLQLRCASRDEQTRTLQQECEALRTKLSALQCARADMARKAALALKEVEGQVSMLSATVRGTSVWSGTGGAGPSTPPLQVPMEA
ncbi:MAG: hypothetical protein EOO41_00555 [Methanobacteriota archaeon]|nr:MAG: hypothetical protein EOO41_00555 [Euryarchaeota archaeon]